MAILIQKIFTSIYRLLHLPNSHPWDYITHFLLSGLGVIIIFFIFKLINLSTMASLAIAVSLMLLISIIKESVDKHLGRDDCLGDLLSNILGIVTATLVLIKILIH